MSLCILRERVVRLADRLRLTDGPQRCEETQHEGKAIWPIIRYDYTQLHTRKKGADHAPLVKFPRAKLAEFFSSLGVAAGRATITARQSLLMMSA